LDTASAVEAKNELDGQNIYSGCCTLRIQFSSLQNLNVKFNNEKSRDFTNPNLPTTPADNMHPVPMIDYNPYAYPNPGVKSTIGMAPQGIPVLIVSGLDPEVRRLNEKEYEHSDDVKNSIPNRKQHQICCSHSLESMGTL